MAKRKGEIGDHCGVPALIARYMRGPPSQWRRLERPEKKERMHFTMYLVVFCFLRQDVKTVGRMLSNPPLMLRKIVVTLSFPACSSVILSVSVVAASLTHRPGRDPHCPWVLKPEQIVQSYSWKVTIRSRILDTVSSSTMILKPEGSLNDRLPGFGRMIQFTALSE